MIDLLAYTLAFNKSILPCQSILSYNIQYKYIQHTMTTIQLQHPY